MTFPSDLTNELASGTYEITVAGALGPVLRAAMQPLVTTASGPCTTLRTALRRTGDLADVFALLDAKGLEVTHLTVRGPAPPRPAPRWDVVHPARMTRVRRHGTALERWPSGRR